MLISKRAIAIPIEFSSPVSGLPAFFRFSSFCTEVVVVTVVASVVIPLKKEIRALDEKIEKLSARKKTLEEQLVAEYSADGSIELALLNDQLKNAEEDWLRLNEECEAALVEDK